MSKYKTFYLSSGRVKQFRYSDRFLFFLISVLLVFSFFPVLSSLNEKISTVVPAYEGKLNEGIVGFPISINPLFAEKQVEKDISSLVYSGLIRVDANGGFYGDLAYRWESDEDGLTYRFYLNENAYFHNGIQVRPDDVVFTINRVKSVYTNSPIREKWSGIDISVLGKNIIEFKLDKPEASFERMATIGILPEQVWKKVGERETKLYRGSGSLIGSGPFRVEDVISTMDGLPTLIRLEPFTKYALGEPYLRGINFHFFRTNTELIESYIQGKIDTLSGISPTDAPQLLNIRKGSVIFTGETGRVFGVFFDVEDGKILSDPFLRSILASGVERDKIIRNIFNGYAKAIYGPHRNYEEHEENFSIEESTKTLDDIGWTINQETGLRERDGVEFSIKLLIQDLMEFRQITRVLTEQWDRLGVDVSTTETDSDILEQFADDGFDAVLYGYDTETSKSIIKFWHSSNDDSFAALINYGNNELNNLLDELSGAQLDQEVEKELYNSIKGELDKDVPAVFLYSPNFLYILPKEILGAGVEYGNLGEVLKLEDRFSHIEKWHVSKEKVWPVFIKYRNKINF